MEPKEFARLHFEEYRTKGEEIVPTYCPFCSGGQNHDKHTFALNIEDGSYNCKRGTCGVAGSFKQLQREYGIITENPIQHNYTRRQSFKTYKKPEVTISPAQKKVEDYLTKRGISKETWQNRGVGEKDGNIAFPYYENGKLVFVKYRKPEKYTGKGQKAWRESDTKPVFWGMDDCDPNHPLIIVEGELDALVLDEVGAYNVVSVPSGAEDLECVDLCWDWIQQFKRIVIWPDNDEPGENMLKRLVQKLGVWRCWKITTEYKDANEALYKAGKEKVLEILSSAEEIPIAGLVRLSEVQSFTPERAERVKSSLVPINKILGGWMLGLLTVWTGLNGGGKSTLLGQEMLTAIDQGYRVCVYSGELPAPMFRFWTDLQAAGPNHLKAEYDPIKEEEVFHPQQDIVPLLREWYYDYYYLYDSYGGAGEDDLLEVFDYAYKRHDCRIFLVDNLMTTQLENDDSNFYRKQSNFVGKLKDFARHNGVHVHLVAHPRKTEGRPQKMDVMGSGDITNRADNVLSVHRFQEEAEESDGVIDVFKNRIFGRQDVEIFLRFDEQCKRFYLPTNMDSLEHQYGWIDLMGVD